MTRADLNVWLDEHSGGWVVEVRALGEWRVLGVYGTRAAALQRAGGAQ